MRIEYWAFLSIIKLLLIALGIVLLSTMPKDGICMAGFVPAFFIEIACMMQFFGNAGKNITLE